MKGIMIQLKTVQGLFHVEATESILLMQAFENSTHLSAGSWIHRGRWILKSFYSDAKPLLGSSTSSTLERLPVAE
jgi:hypothetical protein